MSIQLQRMNLEWKLEANSSSNDCFSEIVSPLKYCALKAVVLKNRSYATMVWFCICCRATSHVACDPNMHHTGSLSKLPV